MELETLKKKPKRAQTRILNSNDIPLSICEPKIQYDINIDDGKSENAKKTSTSIDWGIENDTLHSRIAFLETKNRSFWAWNGLLSSYLQSYMWRRTSAMYLIRFGWSFEYRSRDKSSLEIFSLPFFLFLSPLLSLLSFCLFCTEFL